MSANAPVRHVIANQFRLISILNRASVSKSFMVTPQRMFADYPEGNPTNQVYIGGIKSMDDFSEEQLKETMSEFGTVTEMKVLTPNERLDGKFFVHYATVEEAQAAVEGLKADSSKVPEGAIINFARGKRPPQFKVYVGNLNFRTEEW